MKKLICLLFVSSVACADFQFGSETYNSAGQTLIVNSLGDQTTLSTLHTTGANGVASQSLGADDFIGESGVKNTLAISGYTQALDYNPTAVNSFGVYNQPIANLSAYTKLTFSGLDGDPRTNQDVYVLTSEYNRLSDQGQATSIDSLNAETNSLALGLNSETNARVAGDVALQSQINQTNQNVSNLSDRVNNLERLKVMPEADIRVYDSKYLTMTAYDSYDSTNARNFAVGMRVTLKLGKSYEQSLIEKQAKEIADMEAAIARLEPR